VLPSVAAGGGAGLGASRERPDPRPARPGHQRDAPASAGADERLR